MQPAVRAEYTDDVRAGVAAAVGVAPDAMRDLGGFESFVHEADVRGRPYIVKATWGGRRTPPEIGAELHFVNYLADGGAPACRALPLASGELIATVPSASGVFHVSAFAKAPGRHRTRDEWTRETFVEWGRLVGLLHRLSSAYPGPPPPLARTTWEAEEETLVGLVAEEPEVHARFRALLDTIGALPRTRGAFGAMHTDLHRANIHWEDDGAMHVFDFEDMVDFWFVSDLAIVLYYGVLNPVWSEDRQSDYDRAKPALLEGYAREHALPAWSWDALPLFLSLREHTLRAVILRSIPPEKRQEQTARYLDAATARILTGEPALGLRA